MTIGDKERDGGTGTLWLAAVGVVGIAVLSFLPAHDKSLLHTMGRLHAAGHVLAFALLSFAAGRAARSMLAGLWVVCGALLLAYGTEMGEHLVYGSPLERRDVLRDGVGVLLGVTAAVVARRRAAGRREMAL